MRRDLATAVVVALMLGGCGLESPASGPSDTSPLSTPTITSTTTSTSTTTTTVSPSTTMVAPTTTPTTTVPVDLPVVFEVVAPQPDQRVSERWYVFEGTAPPGSRIVAAGSYPVDIGPDGKWSIELMLLPGGNIARLAFTPEDGGETEVRIPVYYDPPIELRAGGLGSIDLRWPMDEAADELVELLGPPDLDDVYTPDTLPTGALREFPWGVFAYTGYPAHEFARFMSWDAAGLSVMFSDAGPDGTIVPPEFNGWIARSAGQYGAIMKTDGGVAIGDSLTDLDSAYGADLTVYDEMDPLTEDWHFVIESAGQGVPDDMPGLRGRFTGDPTDPATRIEQFEGGLGFDEC